MLRPLLLAGLVLGPVAASALPLPAVGPLRWDLAQGWYWHDGAPDLIAQSCLTSRLWTSGDLHVVMDTRSAPGALVFAWSAWDKVCAAGRGCTIEGDLERGWTGTCTSAGAASTVRITPRGGSAYLFVVQTIAVDGGASDWLDGVLHLAA